ncbi:MAG: NAD(P)H-dependent glycerol-3-phosphate dehydrogenase [Bacteroidales bacterium]|nr:NAD(P)H-dependent glycerol-3-phosphate dehydrogenase [Bacteroidales bacterium]
MINKIRHHMIGLFGSGSWATAIVKILLEKQDREIYWWVREHEIVEGLLSEGHNPFYLSEAYIDINRVHLTSDINDVADHCDDLFLVVPSAFVAGALKSLTSAQLERKHFISAVKGVVPETNQIVTDYLRDTLKVQPSNMAIVSGPSHAEETARNRLTYLTVASGNKALVKHVRDILDCHYVKTSGSTDMQGIEYGAVLKNIYAIATGICHGLGYGDNIIAVLISNAMQEMDTFLHHIEPLDSRKLEEYAYLGDLLVTCYSQFSRNRTFGSMIGFGYTVKAAQLEMKMVAEGYYAVNGIEKMRSAMNISMPIEEAVYRILYKKESASKVMKPVVENFQ